MKAIIHCIAGKYKGRSFSIDGEATIGKDPHHDIVLSGTLVSKDHARITYNAAGEYFIIEDIGSRTGILVDEEFVETALPVRDGQQFTIGNAYTFSLTLLSGEEADSKPEPESETEPEQTPEAQPPAPEPEPAKAPEAVPVQPESKARPTSEAPQAEQKQKSTATVSSYFLEGEGLDGSPVIQSLVEGVNLIGRDPTNRIVLNDSSVSRHHAVILVEQEGVIVRDLDSKNHTFVDGTRIEEDTAVSDGSRILIGLVPFTLRDNS